MKIVMILAAVFMGVLALAEALLGGPAKVVTMFACCASLNAICAMALR